MLQLSCSGPDALAKRLRRAQRLVLEHLKEQIAALVGVIENGLDRPEIAAGRESGFVKLAAATGFAVGAIPNHAIRFLFDVEIAAAARRALGGELPLAAGDVVDAVAG
jgi:hypothetical protein